MNDELKEILEKIRAVGDEMARVKSKRYAELYSKNEMSNYSEIQQYLNMTASRMARFIEHRESGNES